MSKSVLTEERAAMLSRILTSDTDRAKKLLGLGASEVVRKINDLGHDFSEDEVRAYGKALFETVQLNDSALEGVAGGANGSDMEEDFILTTIAILTAGAKVVAGGAKVVATSTAVKKGAAALGTGALKYAGYRGAQAIWP